LDPDPTAAPFQNWNELVAAECYLPNASSPLVGGDGRFSELVNNYSWISFDFGPTLLRWMERNSSGLYESILEADRTSTARFGGHGAAMAQVFNHMIMPLADPADKRTQVRWGAEDFERRFGRYPEGMWLPETAVDLDTLEALAESDIKFTVLSPHQGVTSDEEEHGSAQVDPRRAYSCILPSGRTINLFFFDNGISTELAFGDLLKDGKTFADALERRFNDADDPQLINVASDGETYGHHKHGGAVALTECISEINQKGEAAMTCYGEFLSRSPPTKEATVIEGTSWSCPHGLDRWRKDCGCGSELKPGFDQEWRGPLRSSLDWLKGRIDKVYYRDGSATFTDPRLTKEGAGRALTGNGTDLEGYVKSQLRKNSVSSARTGLALMEMIESSALMFASCGWFWEDIARTEPMQALRFAARAIELAKALGEEDLTKEFVRRISPAKPNDPRFLTAGHLYAKVVNRGDKR
jgi:alpha-amylase/alpha-mannosidase (GH57 family)